MEMVLYTGKSSLAGDFIYRLGRVFWRHDGVGC